MSNPIPPMFVPSSPRSNLFLVPSSPNFPWFHQIVGHEHEFALNASITRPRFLPKRPDTDSNPDVNLTPGVNIQKVNGNTTLSEEAVRKIGMSPNEIHSLRIVEVIRSRPNIRPHCQRAFHNDQPYQPRVPSHRLPLELPPPRSPTRQRSLRSLWRKCLRVLYANIKHTRLLSLPSIYLALYFTLNLSLTLYNKSLLIDFPFPYTLSAVHALCGTIGSLILVRTGSSPPPRLNARETLTLLAFSGLYTINIIISNVSLGLVTVPFHQVVRASTPLFTILLSTLILGTRSSRAKLIALVPVVVGVGFATYGDYYFTIWGFFLTLLGTILAALKTIYTNLLQKTSNHANTSVHEHEKSRPYPTTKISSPVALSFPFRAELPPLTPLQLLHLLSPLAFIETTLIAHFSGELDRVWEYSATELRHTSISAFTHGQSLIKPGLSNTQLVLLLMNGVMAFGLNVVSFTANRKVGALSMTVAANVKQVLTILCAVALFNLTITPMNTVGIVLTLAGGAIYAAVELKERQQRVS